MWKSVYEVKRGVEVLRHLYDPDILKTKRNVSTKEATQI